ncbi:MAG: hypothetical protein WC415_03695 [Patescibacteria group bacterium]|jgi:ABC-type multidrug transport system fused ATPase/permease subunit
MRKNKGNGYSAVENELISQWKKAGAIKRHQLLKLFNRQISFLQHERLIHLLVTLFFGGTSIFLGLLVPATADWRLLIIFLIILITTMFYILHYYNLENTCQRWQKLSIKLEEDLLKKKK